jgi:hypothetical protein
VARLRVLPLAVLHNQTPLPLAVRAHPAPDGQTAQGAVRRVPPRNSAPLDWGAGDRRPRRAVLVAWPDAASEAASGGPADPGHEEGRGGGLEELRSEPFALERNAPPLLLTLRGPAVAGMLRAARFSAARLGRRAAEGTVNE